MLLHYDVHVKHYTLSEEETEIKSLSLMLDYN